VVFQVRLADRSGKWRDSPHVRFATDVLPAALLDFAVSSASIGLALYDTTIANNRLMGTASGKVLLYMKNGLPVIATRAGGFEWLEREGCGICVSGVEDIRPAADRIWSDYDRFARNVRRCYDESLEFGRRFEPVARLMAAP
jgi:glycosyltransferase involved in cell wall biosynthesis